MSGANDGVRYTSLANHGRRGAGVLVLVPGHGGRRYRFQIEDGGAAAVARS